MRLRISKEIRAIEYEEKNVKDGLDRIQKASLSFDRIMEGFDVITNKVEEVSAVTQQMSVGIEQVVNSITAIVIVLGESSFYHNILKILLMSFFSRCKRRNIEISVEYLMIYQVRDDFDEDEISGGI